MRDCWGRRLLISFFVLLFVLAWSLRVALFIDIKRSNYPQDGSSHLTSVDIHKYLDALGIPPQEHVSKAAWVGSVGGGLNNISLDELTLKKNRSYSYLLWPYWNLGLIYSDLATDKTTHNQKAFINSYVGEITYRFPSIISYYTHYSKYFAWKYLDLTWSPEIESMVESQYAVLKLNKSVAAIDLNYTVDGRSLSNCYASRLSTCWPNMSHRYSVDLLSSETLFYDHSLWFWQLYKGNYEIKILPDPGVKLSRVYSTRDFEWDATNRVIRFRVDERQILTEVGVSSQKNFEPGLKFLVHYTGN